MRKNSDTEEQIREVTIPTKKLEEYLLFAKEIAKYAGNIMLKHFKEENTSNYKSDNTIVTSIDIEINSYLIHQVRDCSKIKVTLL